MNKKLLVLAIAGALGGPLNAFASTGVSFYGRVGVEYGSVDIDQVAGNNYRQESVSDNAGVSRFGWNITEDLGGGLKANARIEFSIFTGTGVADSAREQWVGLSSDAWGAVQFGRVHSPFKDFAGGMLLDPFTWTNLQAQGSGGAMYAPINGFGATGWVDHAIRYNSPNFGGFSASLLLAPTDATQTDATNGGGNVGGRGGNNNYQIGLKYKIGTSGEVFGGYSSDEANNAQKGVTTNGQRGDDETVWRLGTAWNFGDFRIAAQYDKIENALAGNGGTTCSSPTSASGGGDAGISTNQCNTSLNVNGEGDIWFLSTQYKIGKTTLVLQGGATNADSVSNAAGVVQASEREAKNLTAGAIYMLSKRTRVFGGYQRVSVDGARNVANTTATGTAVLATQPDRSTWTLGLRHDF